MSRASRRWQRHLSMSTEPNQSEIWASCPRGTLRGYARRVQSGRRHRLIARTAVAGLVVVCVAGLANWAVDDWLGGREYHFGGIACHKVRANLDAYFANTLPPDVSERIDAHLRQCPDCQELMRNMKAMHVSLLHLPPSQCSCPRCTPPTFDRGAMAGRWVDEANSIDSRFALAESP